MECSTILAEMQVPSEAEGVRAESLYEALKGVKDKRSRRGKQYRAAVVLTLLVLAKLAGQVKLKGIAEWVKWQAETLTERLPLYRGKVPCANTYRYVSDHIDVTELNAVLGEYFAGANASHTACGARGNSSGCPARGTDALGAGWQKYAGYAPEWRSEQNSGAHSGLVQCHGKLHVEAAGGRRQRSGAESGHAVNRATSL